MPASQILLFDFDGTLIDSTPAVKRGVAAACDRLGRSQPDPAQLDNAIARGLLMGDIVRLLDPTATPAALATWIAAYREAYAHDAGGHPPLFEGVREVLTSLQARGYQLAILSNKTESAIHAALHHFDIGHYFGHVWGEQADLPGKPDPAIFQARIQPAYPGSTADDFQMIGDTIADHDFARRCGMGFYLASYGYGGQHLPMGADTRTIHRLHQLLEHLPPLT